MLLQAMMVSKDPGSMTLVSGIFRGAVIDIQIFRDPDEANTAMTRAKYDAVIVDCTSVPEWHALLTALRKTKSNPRAVAFAVVDEIIGAASAYQSGANLVIEKPLRAEKLAATVRAALGLMARERRRYLRLPLRSVCFLRTEFGELELDIVDVSEGGMAVELSEMNARNVRGALGFRFHLNGASSAIQGKAEMAWTRGGRAGFRFTSLGGASSTELEQWIARHFELAHALSVNQPVNAVSQPA